jgi:hypothetical protein
MKNAMMPVLAVLGFAILPSIFVATSPYAQCTPCSGRIYDPT